MKMRYSIISVVCLFLPRSAPSAPEFSPGPGYAAVPFFTGAGDPANYNAGLQGLDFSADGTAYFFAENRYILKKAPGMPAEELYDYGADVWGSFVRVWGEIVYVGESTNGTVKSVPVAGGPAADLFTLEGNYDGRFNSQSRLFLSANPGWIGNRIYAWWEGQSEAAVAAEVGDYSGPLAFDSAGNLFYGRSTSFPPGPEDVVYYAAAQVAAALDTGIPLTSADWTVYVSGVDAPGHLTFDGGGAAANLFSAASGPGTVSRVSPAGPRLLGRGTYPEKLAFFGDGPLEPFSPSRGGLGVVVTDYNDTYDGTVYLVRACPQNFILGAGDYAAPGQSGIAVFRPANGLWAVRGLTRVYFGSVGDLPVPGDYTGAGTARPAVFRPSTGLWASAGGGRIYFGRADDIPLPRDYDGGGTDNRAVFRPSAGLWAVRGLTRAYFGQAGDFPLPGDYSGSGAVAPAIFRPESGLWAARGVTRIYFGRPGDLPVPGDYAGEGTEKPAIFRPESGLWAVRGLTRFYFGSGAAGDVPVPLDLDGDGVLEPAIFRPESGLWAVRRLTRTYFGSAEDFPAAR